MPGSPAVVDRAAVEKGGHRGTLDVLARPEDLTLLREDYGRGFCS